MALPKTTRKLIESGNLAALEDEWLNRVDEEPEALDYFAATARSLAASGRETAARELLDLLDEHLRAEGRWAVRLDLLARAAPLLHEGEDLHAEILESLAALYPDSELREPLIEHVGLRRAIRDVEKTWKKVEKLRSLMQFRRGTVVWMDGKGAGTVDDVNIELEKFRIDIERSTVTVGFGAAPKVLRPLPDDSFYARKIRDPEALREIAAREPGEILRLVLASAEAPLSASAIRQAVTGLVPAKSWTSWWDAARGDPQLLTTGKGARQRYSWAASRREATEAALDDFAAADLDHKLEIYRREVKKGSGHAREMGAVLLEMAQREAATRPAAALVIGMALEQVGDLELGDISPAALIAASADPTSLVAAIADKTARRRALALLKDERGDWLQAFSSLLLLEDDPRLLSDLADAIAEADPTSLASAFDAIVAHPRRRPGAFVWLAENLPSYPFLEDRSPLRLMQLVLRAEAGREFAPFRGRIRKLIASSETLPHLIAGLSAEQAEQAEQLLARAPVEEYVRQPLINALHLRFPETFKRTDDVLYSMPESISARRIELKELLEVEIPANRRAIEEARALGDLRENFEYKAARQRHEYLAARAGALDADLRRARAIELDRIDASKVRIGCRLSLSAANGDSRPMTILGPWESNPEEGIVSYESDTAKKLIGKRVGDRVEIDGISWTIASIAPLASES